MPQAVRWTLAARTDLLEAVQYLVERSPSAAATLIDQVEGAAGSLDNLASRGAVVRELDIPNVRQLVVGNYRLVYRVEPEAVVILRLIHGSRDFRRAWTERKG